MSFEDINKDELPEDFRYLINSDRVVLSPHIAGWTHESNYKLANVIVEKVKEVFGEEISSYGVDLG
jgi:D-3-phosphoglycerate dehydrogenase